MPSLGRTPLIHSLTPEESFHRASGRKGALSRPIAGVARLLARPVGLV
jgi:hypothetical protein